MTQPLLGIERPLRSIEEFISSLRSATHRFVDVFFDGWKATVLYAIAGALGGILFPSEVKSGVALLVLLVAIVAGIVIAALQSDKKRITVVLFVVRLFIGFAFTTAFSPRDSKVTGLQELRNVQQTIEQPPDTSAPNPALR